MPKSINTIIREEHSQEAPTFIEKSADYVTNFGGSWTFIFLFILFFSTWVIINTYVYYFDDGFLKLNLILSCLSVFQAPFILMSQNRAHTIDRQREERAYRIGLKSEQEIQDLHDKIDEVLDFIKDIK